MPHQPHAAIPRILRFLGERRCSCRQLDPGAAGGIEIHVQAVSFRGVTVTTQRRQQPRLVHRAARAIEPGLAAGCHDPAAEQVGACRVLCRVDAERIGIEKSVARQRDAAEDPVVQSSFQYIDVLGVAIEQEHALGKEHDADSGAGLGIGDIVG